MDLVQLRIVASVTDLQVIGRLCCRQCENKKGMTFCTTQGSIGGTTAC